MSYSKEMKNCKINDEYYENNSQLNCMRIISYIEGKESSDFFDAMKRGYEEMASINLEYAEMGSSSYYDDTIEYESWLFGVWYK